MGGGKTLDGALQAVEIELFFSYGSILFAPPPPIARFNMYDMDFMKSSFPPDRYLSALFTPQSRPAARVHGSKGLGPDWIKVPTGERLYDMLHKVGLDSIQRRLGERSETLLLPQSNERKLILPLGHIQFCLCCLLVYVTGYPAAQRRLPAPE